MSTEVPEGHPVILFDGVCNLCNRWIQFVIRRDPEGVFRFAPLQSDVGEELLAECGFPPDHLDSVVLIEGDEYYTKSGAALRTAKHLGGVYRLLWPLRVVPGRFRDFCYDVVASRRYRWFGKRDQCMMPTPDIRERFLAGGPGSPTPADADGAGSADGAERADDADVTASGTGPPADRSDSTADGSESAESAEP